MGKIFAFLFFTMLGLGSPGAVAASKDTLTVGISAEFETLNPLIASQAATKYMLYLAVRPMVVLTPEMKWAPMIIKEIPTLENKKAVRKGAGLELKFEFVDGLVWGDGTPVTCRDLEFAWTVGRSKNVSVSSREPYDNISAVTWDKATPSRCTLQLKQAKYNYFVTLPDPLPAHLEEPVFKKFQNKTEGYDLNTLYTKDPTNPGLYYGPYVISEVKLGSHVVFKANPRYHGKKPFFQKIVFRLIPNNATLEANLQSGNIDMISTAAGLGVDQAAIFERKVKAGKLPYEVVFEDGVTYAHIDLNLDNPILADLNVRRALSHGFNKKEMIDALMMGKGRPAIHSVTERDPWYTDQVTIYEFSKRKAMKLLDDAGWKMTPSGYREKNGKPLRLVFAAAGGAKINELIEAYLQDKYKAIGVELVLKNEPARVFFGTTMPRRNFEMALYSWVSIPESSPRSILHSESIPSEKNSWAGQNYTGYKNPEADRLIDSLEAELDPAKRAVLAKKILEIYTRDVPVIPIYYRASNSVIPKGMKGYRISGHLFYESLWAENWSL